MNAIDKALEVRREDVKHRIIMNWCPRSLFSGAKEMCKNEETGMYEFNKGDERCAECWSQEV